MRKRISTLKVAGFLIPVMLLFSQCHNFTGSANKGYVIVSFSTAITSISPAGMNYDEYEFAFYRESDNASTVFHKKKGDHFIFTLDRGTVYILEAKAYKKGITGEKLSAEGVSSFFKVDAATIVELKLNAMPGEGQGTFSCFIKYPENATIEALVLEINDSSEMDLTANANTNIASGKISTSVDLESGLYFLILRINIDGQEVSYANGVEIYSGQSTNFGTTSSPVVLTNNDFKSTSATGGKYIALTYDDVGPGDYEDTTRSCLDMLDAENVKATFFVQGTIHQLVEPLVRRINDEEHEIGNHAETHKSLYTYNVLKQEIENTDARIGEVLGKPNYTTAYFRPPYDNQSFDSKGNSVVEAAARDLGKPVIMWDLSTYDFVDGITVPDIYEIIVSCAATNSNEIILLHIQNYQAIVAVYFAINYLRNQGYEFLTVSQYLAHEGLTPVPGQVVGSQRN